METIKIAPSLNEIIVTKNGFKTDFAGGITYDADFSKIIKKYDETWLKQQFSAAVAFSSKRWHLENLLNDFFKVEGKIL